MTSKVELDQIYCRSCRDHVYRVFGQRIYNVMNEVMLFSCKNSDAVLNQFLVAIKFGLSQK